MVMCARPGEGAQKRTFASPVDPTEVGELTGICYDHTPDKVSMLTRSERAIRDTSIGSQSGC